MFKKLEIVLGFILIAIAGLFIGCNVNPFFGVGTEVDLEEPKLAVTSHISGDFVNSNFSISGTCRDNKGIVKVQLQLNGTEPLVTWDATIDGNTIEGGTWVRNLVFPLDAITNTREGDKLLDIFAYDERGNRAQTRMYLTVDDNSPTVTITDPNLKTTAFFNQLITSDNSSDFINLQYFSNGILQIKGYVDDTFIINTTTLNIYSSDNLTAPVKTVTIEKNRALPSEAGENSFPSKFTFNIDTSSDIFVNNKAYLVSISTEDMAGNPNSQKSIGYFYLDQSKDRPSGKISSPSGSPAITFPQSTASGTIWDDDGLNGYYWYLGNIDTNTANFKTWKTPAGYNDAGSSIVVTGDIAHGYVDLSSDVPKILSWQMVTANKKGTFYMYIVPVDVNGLTPVKPISKIFVQKTSDAPTLTIISPDSRTTQKGTINVTLNATGGEDKEVTYLSYRIEGIDNYPSDLSSDYQKIDVSGSTDSNGNLSGYVIPINSLLYVDDVSHDIKLSVYCTNDNSEDSRVTDFYLKADNRGPIVKITNPSANSGLNGKVTVSGTAEDDYSGVKTLYFGYFDNGVMTDALLNNSGNTYDFIDGSSDTNLTNITALSHNKWHKVTFSQAAWNYEFDTTKLANGNNTFYVAASDDKQNVGFIKAVFIIDQNLDKPNATITIPQNDGDVMFPQSTATGEASDDDGLGYIYWFIGKTSVDFNGAETGVGEPTSDHALWGSYAGSNASAGRIDLTANNPKAYSWQLTTPKGTGEYKIHILPVDMNGVATSAKTVKAFTQKSLDKPVLSILGPDPKNTYNGNVNLTFSMNAGEGKILDSIHIKIENDLTDDVVIPGSVGSISPFTYSFDITKYVNSTDHDVAVSAYCSNTESDKEYSAIATLNLKGDDTAPTVAITSPAVNSGLNGPAVISGTAEDDWSGVKTLYFGYFKTPPADLTPDYNTLAKIEAKASDTSADVNGTSVFWHKVTFTQAAWSYSYDTTKITAAVQNGYKLYVAAVDKNDNVGWDSATYDINQDLDKPGARILAPTADSSTFPRSVVSGDATDDDGLKYIYYYIGKSDVDPGVYTGWGDVSTDTAKSGKIDLSATNPIVAAWKIDQTPGGTGAFTIHIVPVDKNGTPGMKRTLTYIQNTSSIPQIQIISPNPSINNKGNIIVEVRATGGGEYKVKEIRYDLSSDIESGFPEALITDGAWGAVVDYSLPAFNSALFTNNTVHDIIVDVWCVNSNGEESQKTRTYLKADNVAPSNSITNPAENSGMNGVWPVYGSISDDWSGVDSLYFSYYTGAEPDMTADFNTLAKIEAKANEVLSSVNGTTVIWHKVDFTQAAWSYNFDTEKITSGAKNYKLFVASVDNVGNVGWKYRTFNIDQSLDYPHSRIIIPLANGNTFPQSVVSAEATDDDGVAKVFWRIKSGDPVAIGDPNLTTGWGTLDPTNDMSGIITVADSPQSYPFQLNTPKGDGKFTVYTQTYDIKGKLQVGATTRTYFQYASNDPQIIIKSPTNLAQTFTGNIKVSVRALGGANYDVSSLKYRITSEKPFDSLLQNALIAVGNTTDATIDIDTSSYTNVSVHDIKVDIYCVNEKGVSSSVTTLNLKADNSAPTTLDITGPDAGSGLNGIATISGAVQDDWSGVNALYFSYYTGSEPLASTYNTLAKIEASSDTNLANINGATKIWHKKLSPSASWDVTIDTEKLTATVINSYKLIVIAADKVGNFTSINRSFKIDQSLDIPGSSVNIPTASSITFPGSTANGEATDDDGLARLHYYIGTAASPTPATPNAITGWGATTGDGSNDIYGTITINGTPKSSPWSITTPTGQGDYHIYLWSVDENEVMQATPTTRTYSQFASRTPTVNIVGLSASDTYSGVVDLAFDAYGGANFNVTKIEYKIISAIKELTDDIIIATPANTVTEDLTFDSSLYTDADCHTITIEVKCTNNDGAGATSNVSTFSIKADNTPPTVAITSPNATSKLNGSATITGTATDDWSGVKAIYIGYFADMSNDGMDRDYSTEADLSADTSATATLGKWIKINPTAAWTYSYVTTVIGNDSSYPLYVAAVDTEGNVSYTSRTFDVDQESDRPSITILTPADASTTTPKSIVSGSAEDDDGISYIYVYMVKGTAAAPVDYRTWDDLKTVDVSGCIIDLSANTPTNYSWTALMPDSSAIYTVYAFVADKNTPTDHNTTGVYYDKSVITYVSKTFKSINFTQKTSDAAVSEILNSVSEIYSGKGDFTVNFKFTGGNGAIITDYYYDISSDIKRTPVSGETAVDIEAESLTVANKSVTFNPSTYFSSTIRDLAISVYCSDANPSDSNVATYYLRADSRNPSMTITEPSDNTKIDTWLASGGWLRGTITDDVTVDHVTIYWVEGDATWDSATAGITLSAGSKTKTFEKQFTLGLLGNTYLEKNFVITAYDSMNNTTVANLKIAKENTPPDTPVLTTPSPLELGDGPGLTISGTVRDNIEVTDVTIDLVGTAWSWKATLGGVGTDKSWSKTFASIQTDLGGFADKNFKVTAYDNQGNSSYLIFTLKGDSTKPVVTVTSHTNNQTYGDGANITLSGKGTDNIEVTKVKILWVEGGVSWEDNVIDNGGTGANGIVFTEVTDDTNYNWSKTFDFTAGANGLVDYTDKTFEITVKDDQNNESTTSIRLTGDNAAPAITIEDVEGSNIGTGATFTLNGSVTDNREVVRVTISADGIATVWDSDVVGDVTLDAGTTSRTWSRTFNILADLGSYASRSFEVTSYDKNGNSSVKRVNLKGDLTAPTIKSTLTAPADMKLGTGATFTITGEVTDDIEPTKIEIRLGGVLKATLTGGSDLTDDVPGVKTKKDWTKTFTILTDLTDYSDKTFEVTAYDAQGNTSVKIFNITGDRVKPAISAVNPANNGSIGTGATLTMTGKITDDVLIKSLSIKNIETGTIWDESLDSGSWTSADGIGFTQVTANKDYNWSKTFNIAGDLTDYSDKTFEITAKDSQNNEFVSTIRLTGDKTAPTVVAPLTTPALIGGIYSLGTAVNFTIAGTVTDNIATTQVEIKVNGVSKGNATLGAGTTSRTWTKTFDVTTDLTDYSDKSFEIIATDAQGNVGVKTFNIVGDRTAPFISGTLSSPATGSIGTGINFTMTGEVTDDIEPETVVIKYNGATLHTLTDVSGLTNNPDAKKKTWTALITIASLGGTYSDKTFEVIAYDAQNNSSAKTFTLLGDRTAPTIGASLIAPALTGGVYPLGDGPAFTITGSVTDDISPTKVEIKYNNSVIWTCQDAGTGLTNNPDAKTRQWTRTFADIPTTFGNYNNKMIEIVAYDAQLNSSVKVFSIIGDTTKPTVAVTSHANNAALPAVFKLSGTCADNIEVTRIVVEHEGGTIWDSTADASMLSGTGTSKTWSKDLTVDTNLGGTYTDKAFTVYAYDAQGNVNSARVTFIGDRTAPTVGISSHSNGAFVKSTGSGFSLSGTAADMRQNGVTAGVVTKVMVKTGVQDHTADFTAPNWSIASSKFTLTEASYTFEISAYDDLGNIKTERVYVTVDNSPPSVVFSSPSDAEATAGLNGTVTVNGTVSDNSSGVKALYISYFAGTDVTTDYTLDTSADLASNSTTISANLYSTTNTTGKRLYEITGFSASWTCSYDTTRIYTDQAAHDYKIYLYAVDYNGNVTKSTTNPILKAKAVKINQSLDKPTASILVPVVDNAAMLPSSTVSGSARDDDGLKYVYIFIGNTTDYPTAPASLGDWIMTDTDASGCRIDLSATNPLSYNWTVTTPSAEGAYKIWVATVDKNTPTGTEGTIVSRPFSQTTSSKPLIYNLTAPNTTYSGPLQINLSASGGGKNVTKINYRILGVVDSGWKTLNGVAGAPGVDEFTISSTVNTSFTFNTATYTSEATTDILVEVQAFNELGTPSDESKVYYRADNTKPVVTITSPSVAGTVINGVQTISGTASDWSTVEALYFGYFRSVAEPDMSNDYNTRAKLNAGSVTTPADPTTDKWFKVSSPSLNWNYNFDTTKVYDDLIEHLNYYFYVAALDKSGNVNYAKMKYTIDQDGDKPTVTITNPGYNGAETPIVRNDNEMAFIPRTYVMMGTVQDGDPDGIQNVHINIDILNSTGDHSADVYPPDATGGTGDGYNVVSLYEPMILGDTETSWTYKISNYALSLPGEFYRVSVRPIDVYGKLGIVKTSYFVITNVAPQVEIISPSILDPDTPETTNPDVYGTVISNVKDDMYWDADSSNNLIYYDDDSNRRNWGWNSDLKESVFNIFDKDVSDDTKSNYYRMIFRAKDNGRVNSVEISVDGGANTAASLSWSGGITSADGHFDKTISDSSKIKDVDVMKKAVLSGNYLDYTYSDINTKNDATSDWIYFFVDIDTTKLSTSSMLKVIVGDNNDPSSYETTASVQVNVDNSAPNTAKSNVLNWGIDSLTENYEFSKTKLHEYIGGDLEDVGSAGVRYVNLYFWKNMQANLDATPDYKENGYGLITATVPSGTHKVSIPENLGSVLVKNKVGDIGLVDPDSSLSDNYPNNWIRAYKYLSSGWRIKKIYTNEEAPSDADGQPGTYYGISTKYGSTYPSDGKKLICLEVVDNAGNKLRKFYEHTFSEYPPTVMSSNISWAALPEESVTDETTGGRKWIGGTFSMNGLVRDYVAGTNPNPGIERVRVYIMKDDNGDGVWESTQKIYTSKATDTVADPKYSSVVPSAVIDTTPALPTATNAQVDWQFGSAQDIKTGMTDGNYMIMVEVRDKTGSTDTMKQYVYIDNSNPTVVVSQPTNTQTVKGDLFVISGTASDALGGGFNAGCVNIKILDATTDALKREWNVSLDPTDVTSPYDWTQDWSLISDASDDFDASESRKVRVTLTDKAGNTHTLPDITVKKGAPPSWPVFTANGSSTAFANATFKSKYTTIGASDPLFMIRGANSVFTTNITDTTQFTGAKVIVSGYRQSDGVLLNKDNTIDLADKSMTIKTGNLTVGENDSAVDDVYTYAGLPDGEYAYKVELHQEAAIINMQKYFIVDNTKPNIWVKKIENTDYGLDGTTLLGHIDRNEDFSATGYTTTTDGETGIVGADMVSGVIKLHIKAKDNYRLKRIRAKMTDLAFIGTLDTTFYTLASRDNTDNWTVPAQRGSITSGVATRDYMKVTNVTGSVLGENYDYVYLIVEFNTAQLTNVAGLNKHLEVIAEDWVGNSTDYTGGATTKNTGTISDSLFYGTGTEIITKDALLNINNAKAVKFVLDVVPYISSIATTDRLNGGLKSNNIRSASGKYSVIKGSLNTFITVNGFNLSPILNGARIIPEASAYKNGLNGVNLQGTDLPLTGSATPYTTLSLTNNSTKSGYLAIVCGTAVAPVGSINNVNSDSVATNQEKDIYITRNPTLTDNRYLRFFSTVSTPTKNGYFPNMILDTDDNPVFGYLDFSGGTAASGAGTYYPTLAMPQRTKYNMSTGSKFANSDYLIKALVWDQMAMAKDSAGRYIHASVYNYDGAGMALVYDKYASLHTVAQSLGWGTPPNYTGFAGPWANNVGNNAISLETTNYSSLLLGRYQYPKLIAKGNSVTSYASVYMLYYDDNTINNDLIFRNLQIGTNAGSRTTALYSGSGYAQFTNFTENTTNDPAWGTGRLTAASGASQYFDMGVTSTNRVVIIYFDESVARLKMRYSSAAVDGSNPTGAITWNDSPVVFPDYVGTYVSMAIDASDDIHIAAFNAADADLTYIYIPDYTVNTKKVVTVDAYGSVGQWTQIKMRGMVPHIAYYNSTETGSRESIKYAYANFTITSGNINTVLAGVDSSNYTTNNWEYMTVPALTPPQGGNPKFKQVNMDFNTGGRPVFGYLGTNIEFSSIVTE